MILSALIFLSSKVTVTVEDAVLRWYLDTPSILDRIYLILPRAPVQLPPGRLGRVNLTVVPAAAVTVCWEASRRKRLATRKIKAMFLCFIAPSIFNISAEPYTTRGYSKSTSFPTNAQTEYSRGILDSEAFLRIRRKPGRTRKQLAQLLGTSLKLTWSSRQDSHTEKKGLKQDCVSP